MQEKQLYEYAIIRVVPRVERGEYLNVGIVLFCKKINYLHCKILLDEVRISCFAKQINLTDVNQNLQAFEKIALGDHKSLSPIAQLDAASRFRWLTAKRSTVIQCSTVHPGLTLDLESVMNKLFQEMVL